MTDPQDHLPVVDEHAYEDELEPDARSRPTSRRWWWISALLLVPALALLTWIGVMNAKDAITHRVVGYQVEDDRTVTVDFEVERPAGWTVRCEVRALDVRYGTVGSLEVDVPPSQGPARRQVTLRTSSRAVTGTVKLCEHV